MTLLAVDGRVDGETIPDGTSIAFEACCRLILATRPLVPPVTLHCTTPVWGSVIHPRVTDPLAFTVRVTPPQSPLVVADSPGWNPSPEKSMKAPPVVGATGRSMNPRLGFWSPSGGGPASDRSSTLCPASEPAVASYEL
jgi:hypothetical protein